MSSFGNAKLQFVLDNLGHGFCMFDQHDRLELCNKLYADLWDLPSNLTQPGTLFKDIMAASRGSETPESLAQPRPVPGWTGTWRREWVMEDGRFIEVTVTRLADSSTLALHEDITSQRTAQAQIIRMASHDHLTGLPNRRAMVKSFEKLLARNARGEELAVMCLDLDRFKNVNDTWGHAMGDLLLEQVAHRLRACVRDTDQIIRLGGDEFAIMQCGAPQPGGSTVLAQRIITSLNEPFDLKGNVAQIGISIGVAIAPYDGQTHDALLKSADIALYRAKDDGRGVLRYFEPAMDASTQANRGLEADLRLALERNQLHLVYQPQIDIETRTVTAVEALLRWSHPTLGAISPVKFIPMAEKAGLIEPIGRWVLEHACLEACHWPSTVRIAINASMDQFVRGHMVQSVRESLSKSGLDPDRLELEITESLLMQEPKHSLATMNDLRQTGVRMALDDFGTGYSALSYLLKFPLTRIKIDRAFVQDIDRNPRARAIVRAIVSMGQSLGLSITVEGIETEAQLQAVHIEGCREIQGYLFCKPLPATELLAFIHQLPSDPVWDSLESFLGAAKT